MPATEWHSHCRAFLGSEMFSIRTVALVIAALAVASRAAAQAPPAEPPPLWDVQLGASFVGTSGNSETASMGADFSFQRRWPPWQVESAATAVRSSDRGVRTAERYLGLFRGNRALSPVIGLSSGIKLERDQFAGIDFRSVLDGGLSWALVRAPRWTLDGLTALTWNHEQPVLGDDRDDPGSLLQLLSRIPIGAAAGAIQRFTHYPNFADRRAHRSEAELAAQAAMNSRIALKLGYLWRYSNAPVAGFKKADSTTTMSVVMRWRAATAAPAP